MMADEDQGKAIGKLIAKAWADEGFKARLLADPATVLAAEGVQTPAGVAIKVVENTPSLFNLVLPARPDELSDSELDQAAGGFSTNGCAAPSGGAPVCSIGFSGGPV
jgi:hypothetical protein